MTNISVVIPTYNRGKYITRAIDSVITQTKKAHQIIVVNDGSTDDTLDKLSLYKDKITVLSQKNQGAGAARNTGINYSTSEWISFLDSDDFYYENRISEHHSIISNNDKIDVIFGNCDIERNGYYRGDVMSITDFTLHNPQRTYEIINEDQIENFGIRDPGNMNTVTVRRELCLRLGGFPTDLRTREDLYLLLAIVATTQNIAISKIPVARYLERDGTLLKRGALNTNIDDVHALTRVKQKYVQNGPPALLRGVNKRLFDSRMNCAYAYLKAGKRLEAIQVAVPILKLQPNLKGLRAILSIIKG